MTRVGRSILGLEYTSRGEEPQVGLESLPGLELKLDWPALLVCISELIQHIPHELVKDSVGLEHLLHQPRRIRGEGDAHGSLVRWRWAYVNPWRHRLPIG